MRALELDAVINEQHEIHLKLPDDVNASTAKVIVMYEENTEEKKEKRIFGQFRGQIKIADDFDDPLPDEFWLGEDV